MRNAKWVVAGVSMLGITGAAGAATESASAIISLSSITGTPSTPVYNYSLSLHDTGPTNLETFWYSWVPGQDFLATDPLSVTNPTGWNDNITGSGGTSDGFAIQWVTTTAPLGPGNTLSGFEFSSHDSPSVLLGDSPTHPSTLVDTSFVYIGAPLSDAGFKFVVTSALPEPVSCVWLAGAVGGLLVRKPREKARA